VLILERMYQSKFSDYETRDVTVTMLTYVVLTNSCPPWNYTDMLSTVMVN
jgi:hypothetical protein